MLSRYLRLSLDIVTVSEFHNMLCRKGAFNASDLEANAPASVGPSPSAPEAIKLQGQEVGSSGSGGSNSEKKPRKRGGKKHRNKKGAGAQLGAGDGHREADVVSVVARVRDDRPIVTCGQMGGGASAAYSAMEAKHGPGLVDDSGLNWQQKHQLGGNPFLQFKLDARGILSDVLV
eukprot:SAG31_NODE_6036_length_2198_cov_1.559790_3_plen_175_part_00